VNNYIERFEEDICKEWKNPEPMAIFASLIPTSSREGQADEWEPDLQILASRFVDSRDLFGFLMQGSLQKRRNWSSLHNMTTLLRTT